ncbi:DUF3080 family protein [Motilimonas pumila]|uniref:DUF3080 family protein n=1 Tax=Motilimonas pumila TaxID=2303987 RepID=A0A418Y9X3_9GAMM|nr:DUF3080 family protein [Motilimonas pumila]RJG38599.1 DUF3080 family protein [Motilimonas pumila]
MTEPWLTHIIKFLLAASVVAVTSACSPAEQAMFTEYNERLARVLDTQTGASESSKSDLLPANWPSRKELFQSNAAPTISVIELLALPDCGLKYLISQRNEILAKHMNTAAQLHYEIDMIVALKRCQNEFANKMTSADISLLTKIEAEKQQNITGHFLNLLFAEPETHLALKPITKTVAGRSHQHEQDVIEAFDYFKGLSLLVSNLQQGTDITLEQRATFSLEHTQQALSRLYNNRYFSELVFSMQFAKTQLAQATLYIQTVSDNNHCQQFSKQKIAILKNVLMLFYIQQQQPYMVELIQSYQQIRAAVIGSLLTQTNLTPKQSQVVIYYNSGIDIELKKSSQEHARAWQTLLKQCNIQTQSLVSGRKLNTLQSVVE